MHVEICCTCVETAISLLIFVHERCVKDVFCSFPFFFYTFAPIPYAQKSDLRFHSGLCICSILHYDLCFNRAACVVPSSGVAAESSRRRGFSWPRSSRTACSYSLGSLLDPT